MPRKVTEEERILKSIKKMENRKRNEERWFIEAKQIHPTYNYDVAYFETRTDTSGRHINYIVNVRCSAQHLFTTRKDVHIGQRCKCPICQNYPNNKTADERKQELLDRAHRRFGFNRFDYSEVNYENKYKPVWIRCIDHNYRFKMRLDEHARKSGGCPYCSQSSGESDIRKYLEDNDITFISQYHIEHNNPQCKREYLSVDFYLPAFNMYIEFNGEQHYASVPHFFNKGFTFDDQQERDKTLRTYCKQHDICLLEIPYTEQANISQILSRELNMLN